MCNTIHPIADIKLKRHVRNVPTTDLCTAANYILFDHLVGERQQGRGHEMPSAFAVFKLITK